MNSYLQQLTKRLSPLTREIVEHPIYRTIGSLSDLRLFMEHHVFAVWDFMCLLKELYRGIVSTSAPWFPSKDPLSAHLISQILVEEEGDVLEDGVTYVSHYEMYLSAMEQAGADTQSIKRLLSLLETGHDLSEALIQAEVPSSAQDFVLTTFSFFDAKIHELAAAFVYGREGVTSPMFLPLLKTLEEQLVQSQPVGKLIYYLKRHIELDSTEHFPLALKMLSHLAEKDEEKWHEIEAAAIKALKARITFLTRIQQSMSFYRARRVMT